MKATTASPPSLLLCYSLLDTNGNNRLKYLEFYFRPKPLNSELNAMTVPQHRLVLKEPADRARWPEEGGVGERRTAHPHPHPHLSATQCTPPAALGSYPLGSPRRGIMAAGGQNASLCEGVLFLTSIPRALSPGTDKALAPHWTEHTASLQHSNTAEGHCGS